jgi:hypothetical protein
MPDVNNGAMTGADRINHSASIGSQKRRGGSAGLSRATHTRPMAGNAAASYEILTSAGLGRRAPEKKSPGEQMSDADQPEQEVAVGNGQAVHRKATLNGGVREIPIASPLDHADLTLAQYPYLNQDNLSNNTNVAAMQRRMGVPPLF